MSSVQLLAPSAQQKTKWVIFNLQPKKRLPIKTITQNNKTETEISGVFFI